MLVGLKKSATAKKHRLLELHHSDAPIPTISRSTPDHSKQTHPIQSVSARIPSPQKPRPQLNPHHTAHLSTRTHDLTAHGPPSPSLLTIHQKNPKSHVSRPPRPRLLPPPKRLPRPPRPDLPPSNLPAARPPPANAEIRPRLHRPRWRAHASPAIVLSADYESQPERCEGGGDGACGGMGAAGVGEWGVWVGQ